MRRGFMWLIVCFFVTSGLCVAQVDDQEDGQPASIDQKMDKLFFEWDRLDRPGGAVVVIKEGQSVYQKAFGSACLEHSLPNTTGTLFDVVSVACPVTAFSIFILEEQGKLALDDDIRDYLTELPDVGQTVTLRHLLYHSSGLHDWTKALSVAGWDLSDVITMDHVLKIVKNQKDLQFEPGSKFEFSTTNYSLLSEIVKRVTGLSFRDWTWENVFRPLGMNRTMVRERPGEPIEHQAYAYDYTRMRGYQRGGDNLSVAGAHCLFSSAQDIAKWMTNLKTGTVGSSAILEKMFQKGILNNGQQSDYAGGFEVDSYKGLVRFTVSGTWQGYNSTLHYFPDHHLGVALLCNWVSGWVNPGSQAQQISEIYLAEELTEQKPETAQSEAESGPEEFKPDPAIYDDYLGDYRWEPGYVVQVIREEDQLLLQTPENRKYQLIPQAENEFTLSFGDYRFIFHQNGEGQFFQFQVLVGGVEDVVAPKIELVVPTQSELVQFCGTYYCPELETRYTVVLRKDTLFMTHLRLKDVTLTPETRDHFTTDAPSYPLVEFIRNEQQEVSGLRMFGFPVLFQKI